MSQTSTSELACVYSALILHDDDVDVTVSENLIASSYLASSSFWLNHYFQCSYLFPCEDSKDIL